MIARRAMIQVALDPSCNVGVDILTNVQTTLRLSEEPKYSWFGSHHNAPDTHPDLENSFEKGAVTRSPFDIQFINASATKSVSRVFVASRVVKTVALIVLGA